MLIAKGKSKKYYDEKLNVQNFKELEMVYLEKGTRGGKLDAEYDEKGPYEITQVFADSNVKLKLG